MLSLTTPYQLSIRSPRHSNQTRKKKKGIQIGNKEAKLSLFADAMIVQIENPIESTKKLLNLVRKSGKAEGYKVSIQKLKAFCTPPTKYQKQKSGKKSHFL